MMEFSPPPSYDPVPERVVLASADSSNPWINELFVARSPEANIKNSPADNTIEFDSGAIARVEIPRGWTAGKQMSPTASGAGEYREFVPPGATDNRTRLQFYESGWKLSEQEARDFRQLLDKPDHALSPPEADRIRSLFGNKSNPKDFRIDAAWTRTTNNQRVLMLEGEFLSNSRKSLTMYVDKNNDGQYTQEVSYLAPSGKFKAVKPAIDKCMDSIIWR